MTVFKKNDIFYDVGAADRLYVYYRDTKTILCHVVLNASNKWNVELIYPFNCLSDPLIFETITGVCSYIRAMFSNTVCNAKYLEFIGMTPNTPEIARKLSEELDAKLRESVRWAYGPSDKSIAVMHPNGKVVCTINPDVIKNNMNFKYRVTFYTPFECPLKCRWSDGKYYNDHPNKVVEAITESINSYQEKEEKEKKEMFSQKHEQLEQLRNMLPKLNGYSISMHGYSNDNIMMYMSFVDNMTHNRVAEIHGCYSFDNMEYLIMSDYVNNCTWTYKGVRAASEMFKRLNKIMNTYVANNVTKEYNTSSDEIHIPLSESISEVIIAGGRGSGKTAMVNEIIKKIYGRMYIKNVIFQDPATIVFWEDDTKTVVKTQNGEEFDPEKGLAMAIAKKLYGNDRGYYRPFLKWIKKYNKQKLEKALEEAKKIQPDEITYHGEKYILKTGEIEDSVKNIETCDNVIRPYCDVQVTTRNDQIEETSITPEQAHAMGVVIKKPYGENITDEDIKKMIEQNNEN